MTHIRVLHAIPNGPNVDIYLNEDLVIEGLAYSRFTSYLPVNPGEYDVTVYQSGTGTDPIISEKLTVPADDILTVAAIGVIENPSLYPIPDPPTPIEDGKSAVRFVHLSPNAPEVDVYFHKSPVMKDAEMGTPLFNNVSYKDFTAYSQQAPGEYTMRLTPAGGKDVVLYVPNINLKANSYYSIYAIGFLNGEPPLSVVIPLDGQSYIK